MKLAAAPHVLRVRGRRDVERARHRSAPVQQQRLEVVVTVEDAETSDVEPCVVERVQPAEAQSVVGDVEPGDVLGQRPHLGIAFHGGAAVLAQRGGVPALRLCPLGVQPRVEPGDIIALGLQFVLVVPT